ARGEQDDVVVAAAHQEPVERRRRASRAGERGQGDTGTEADEQRDDEEPTPPAAQLRADQQTDRAAHRRSTRARVLSTTPIQTRRPGRGQVGVPTRAEGGVPPSAPPGSARRGLRYGPTVICRW